MGTGRVLRRAGAGALVVKERVLRMSSPLLPGVLREIGRKRAARWRDLSIFGKSDEKNLEKRGIDVS